MYDRDKGKKGSREGGEKGKKDVTQPVEPAHKREIWKSRVRTLRKQNKPYFVMCSFLGIIKSSKDLNYIFNGNELARAMYYKNPSLEGRS